MDEIHYDEFWISIVMERNYKEGKYLTHPESYRFTSLLNVDYNPLYQYLQKESFCIYWYIMTKLDLSWRDTWETRTSRYILNGIVEIIRKTRKWCIVFHSKRTFDNLECFSCLQFWRKDELWLNTAYFLLIKSISVNHSALNI